MAKFSTLYTKPDFVMNLVIGVLSFTVHLKDLCKRLVWDHYLEEIFRTVSVGLAYNLGK